MCSGGDARGAMNVDPDVTLTRDERLSRVDPNAYLYRAAALEGLPRFDCRRDGVGGSGKCDEEGIALGVHLDTVMSRERLPQDASMVSEQIGVF